MSEGYNKNSQFTHEDLNSYLLDLQYIVNIDSPTNYKAGISKLHEFFEKKAIKTGLKVVRKLCNPEAGPCLIISNADVDTTEGLDFLLLAHLDTVFEVGSAKEHPFVLKENGIAHGCGVVDNKAGALLGLYLLEKINLDKCKIALLLNSNEETGSHLNSDLIKELAEKSKYTLVLEPTRENGSFVDKRYGMLNYKIDFIGEKSITGNYSDGASALLEAANFMKLVNISNSLSQDILMNFTIKTDPAKHLGDVIDKVTLGMQVRYVSSDCKEKIKTKIDYAITHKMVDKVKITVNELQEYPGIIPKKEAEELKSYIWVSGKKSGYDVNWTSSFGGSDGCFASLTNSIVLDGLGPLGGNFHTKEEYLDTTHVSKICNILINTINTISQLKKRD